MTLVAQHQGTGVFINGHYHNYTTNNDCFGLSATAIFGWWAWQSKQTINKVADHDVRIVRLEEKV